MAMPLSHSMRALNLARMTVFRRHYHRNVIGTSPLRGIGLAKEPPPLKPFDSAMNIDCVMEDDKFHNVVDSLESNRIEKEEVYQVIDEKSPNQRNPSLTSHSREATNNDSDKQDVAFGTFCELMQGIKSFPFHDKQDPHNRYTRDVLKEYTIDLTRLNRSLGDVMKSSDATWIGKEMAYRLHEPKSYLIVRSVRVLGTELVSEIFAKTKDVVNKGGMTTLRGDRQRTPGGIFLYLMKNRIDVTQQQIAEIIPHDQKRQEKQRPLREVKKDEETMKKNEGIVKKNEETAKKIDGIVKENRKRAKKEGEAAIRNEEMSKKHEKTVLKSEKMSEQIEGTAITNEEMPKKNEEMLKKSVVKAKMENLERKKKGGTQKAKEKLQSITEAKCNVTEEKPEIHKEHEIYTKSNENTEYKSDAVTKMEQRNMDIKRTNENSLSSDGVKSKKYQWIKSRLEIVTSKHAEIEKVRNRKRNRKRILPTRTRFQFGEDVKLVDLL